MVTLAKTPFVSLIKREADDRHRTDRQRAIKTNTAKGR